MEMIAAICVIFVGLWGGFLWNALRVEQAWHQCPECGMFHTAHRIERYLPLAGVSEVTTKVCAPCRESHDFLIQRDTDWPIEGL